MSDRLYFLFGDVLSNVLVGTLAALVCVPVVSPEWNMFVAMVVCMPLGMLTAVVLGTFLIRWFGAMEVMVPTMLGGMTAGMVVGMACAMTPIDAGWAVRAGALIGLVALVFCRYADYLIRGAHRMRREGQRGH